MNIKGLEFICTCGACPEQYDVFKDGKQVAYVRLRWGHLFCEYPDVFGECIYDYSFGDAFLGHFPDEEERKYHLDKIADKILEKIGG